MINEGQVLEMDVLKDLQASYEQRGLKFYINPSSELVPPFLEGYRPDAIALRPNGSAIIEIIHRQGPATKKHFSELSKRFGSTPVGNSWEFIRTRSLKRRPILRSRP